MATCYNRRDNKTPSQIPCSEKPLGLRCASCIALVNLDERIRQLQAQRLTVLSEINQIHDPFNRFPIEICAEIFQKCLPGIVVIENYKHRDTVRQISRTPLLLSQICRKWRAICHSSPNIWTVIPLFTGRSQRLAAEVELAWLGRSGDSLPLFIILLTESTADLARTNYRPIFDLIAMYAPRIHYLEACLPTPALRELCAAYKDRENLKVLRLFCDYLSHLDENRRKYIEESKFRPTSLRIDKSSSIILGIVDTTILTHLEVNGLFASDCLTLLAQSPILVTCTLNGAQFDAPVPQRRFVHSHLQCLSIDPYVESKTTCSILEALNLPSLHTMTLRLRSNSPQFPVIDAMVKNLRRSGSSLTTLSLHNLFLRTPDQYLMLGELFNMVAPSLDALDLSVEQNSLTTPSERNNFLLFLWSLVPRLHKLRSIVWFGPKEYWIRMLWKLLAACLSIVSTTGQGLLVTLWSHGSPLNSSGNFSADTAYDFTGELVPLRATEILNMMDITQNPLIALKVKYSPAQWIGDRQPETDIDISVEVMTALGSLASQTQEG